MDVLSDTVDLMLSDDHKDRFVAEYMQLYIRTERLKAMLHKYRAGTLDFTPACPIDILEEQASIMDEYLQILEKRASIEGIELS